MTRMFAIKIAATTLHIELLHQAAYCQEATARQTAFCSHETDKSKYYKKIDDINQLASDVKSIIKRIEKLDHKF